MERGKWSASELVMLRSLQATLGNQWTQIAIKLGRLPDGCRLKYESVSGKYSKGKWTVDEDDHLISLVCQGNVIPPPTQQVGWKLVSARLQTRDPAACRTRWTRYLYPRLVRKTEDRVWTVVDDRRLIKTYATHEAAAVAAAAAA